MRKCFLYPILFLSISVFANKSYQKSENEELLVLQEKINVIEELMSDPPKAYAAFLLAMEFAKTDTAKSLLSEFAYNTGSRYYNLSNYRYAEPFLKKSAEISLALADSVNYAWTLYQLAITQKYWGHYRDALQSVINAKNTFSKFNDKPGIAFSLMVEVYIYEAWGRYEEIEPICREALSLFKDLKVSSGEAYCLLALGNLYLERNLSDSAFHYYSQALTIFESINSKYGTAIVKRDLGRYYKKVNDSQNALNNFTNALKIHESISNKRGISEVEMLMGNLFLDRGEFSRAIHHLEKGQALAIEIELVEDMVRNYLQLSRAYERIGNQKKSLDNLKRYVILKDSVFNAEKHLQLADMQTKYETEKKEQQIALQNVKLEKNTAELSRKNIFILSLIGGLLLLIALSFLVYTLYRTKRSDNRLLSSQKLEIEKKNQQITDSITYARKIQNAVLSNQSELQQIFPDSFILFMPKDIVSGDFFFFRRFNSKILITAADCTGHGVPGAFMSMLGITLLNEILGHGLPETASQVLEILREKAKEVLHQSSFQSESKDGIEMALCIYDEANRTIQFSGAGNPLYRIRNGEISVIKGTRSPIGVNLKEFPFENHIIEVEQGDCFYLFSDGFADQIGGHKGDKVKISEFKNLIINNWHLSMVEQRQAMEDFIITWMIGYEQIDDILVIGFRL